MSTTTSSLAERKQVKPEAESRVTKGMLPQRAPNKRSGFLMLVLALAVAGGLTVLYGLSQAGQITVLTTNESVVRGQAIEAQDLTSIEVGKDTPNVVEAESAEQIIGKKALVDLTAGSLVGPDNTGDSVNFSSEETVVGIGVAPANAPARTLVAGDTVRVVFTPSDPETKASGVSELTGIVEASSIDENEGTLVVDVRLKEKDAANAARWSAASTAAIILDGADGK